MPYLGSDCWSCQFLVSLLEHRALFFTQSWPCKGGRHPHCNCSDLQLVPHLYDPGLEVGNVRREEAGWDEDGLDSQCTETVMME